MKDARVSLNIVIIENYEFPDESALLENLMELKGDCFFNVFIGKYSTLILFVFSHGAGY